MKYTKDDLIRKIENNEFFHVKALKTIRGGFGTYAEDSDIFSHEGKYYKFEKKRFSDKATNEKAVYPSDEVITIKLWLVDENYDIIEEVYYQEDRYNEYKD